MTFALFAHPGNRKIAADVRVARGPRERVKGLIGSPGLDRGRALVLHRTKQVHTFGMRFSIDVVFLGSEGQVLRIVSRLAPRRVSPLVLRARSVVEMAAGGADGLSVGDRVEVTEETP